MPWDFWPHRHSYFFQITDYWCVQASRFHPAAYYTSSKSLPSPGNLGYKKCSHVSACHPVRPDVLTQYFQDPTHMGYFGFTQCMLANLFQQVNYSRELTFPLILPTGGGYETRWGWILRKSIIFQGFFLRLGLWKGSRERKAAFLHSPEKKWLLLAQKSEDSRVSSFYPSKCSHPRSFFF